VDRNAQKTDGQILVFRVIHSGGELKGHNPSVLPNSGGHAVLSKRMLTKHGQDDGDDAVVA